MFESLVGERSASKDGLTSRMPAAVVGGDEGVKIFELDVAE